MNLLSQSTEALQPELNYLLRTLTNVGEVFFPLHIHVPYLNKCFSCKHEKKSNNSKINATNNLQLALAAKMIKDLFIYNACWHKRLIRNFPQLNSTIASPLRTHTSYRACVPPEHTEFLLFLHVPHYHCLVPGSRQYLLLALHPRHVKYCVVVCLPVCTSGKQKICHGVSYRYVSVFSVIFYFLHYRNYIHVSTEN